MYKRVYLGDRIMLECLPGLPAVIQRPVPPRPQTSHRICVLDNVITVWDLEGQTSDQCHEGPSLPGAGHVSSPLCGRDMDITGCRLEDLGSFPYETPATDSRCTLDRSYQQRDCLVTYGSHASRRANCQSSRHNLWPHCQAR